MIKQIGHETKTQVRRRLHLPWAHILNTCTSPTAHVMDPNLTHMYAAGCTCHGHETNKPARRRLHLPWTLIWHTCTPPAAQVSDTKLKHKYVADCTCLGHYGCTCHGNQNKHTSTPPAAHLVDMKLIHMYVADCTCHGYAYDTHVRRRLHMSWTRTDAPVRR